MIRLCNPLTKSSPFWFGNRLRQPGQTQDLSKSSLRMGGGTAQRQPQTHERSKQLLAHFVFFSRVCICWSNQAMRRRGIGLQDGVLSFPTHWAQSAADNVSLCWSTPPFLAQAWESSNITHGQPCLLPPQVSLATFKRMLTHRFKPQCPQSDKEGLRTTQDWESLSQSRVWIIEHGNRGPAVESYSHTYIVQLVVEPAGVTHGIAVGISPPQGGSGGLTVRAGRARSPGCGLREGGGETGEEKERERKAPMLKQKKKKKRSYQQNCWERTHQPCKTDAHRQRPPETGLWEQIIILKKFPEVL